MAEIHNFDFSNKRMTNTITLDDCEISHINFVSTTKSTTINNTNPMGQHHQEDEVMDIDIDTTKTTIPIKFVAADDQNNRNGQHRTRFVPTRPLINSQCNTGTFTTDDSINVSPAGFVETNSQCAKGLTSLPGTTAMISFSPSSIHRRQVTPMPAGKLEATHEISMLCSGSSISINSHDVAVTTDTMKSACSKCNCDVARENPVETARNTNTAESSLYNQEYYKSTSFPVVVHRMITEVCSKHSSKIMHWSTCGQFFFIHSSDAKLKNILQRYFNHNQYQSLRRQLNAYGFKKFTCGEHKGYWYRQSFNQCCLFEELKRILSTRNDPNAIRKGKNMKVTNIKRPTTKKKLDKQNQKHKGRSKDVVAVAFVPESSIFDMVSCQVKAFSPICTLSKGTTLIENKSHKEQFEGATYETKKYAGCRHNTFLHLTDGTFMSRIGSNEAEPNFLPIQDTFSSDSGDHEVILANDSGNDALNALATVACFLPIATMNEKSYEGPVDHKGNLAKNEAIPAEAVSMSIFPDTANLFVPTPIKVPTIMGWGHLCWTDTLDCCLDECLSSSYSVSSLSSPVNLVLPSSDRSAFTPLIRTIDQMVADFCESIDSSMCNERFTTSSDGTPM